MRSAQQRFAGGQRLRGALRQVFLDRRQVRGDLALQDVEQNRVDVGQRPWNNGGIGFDRRFFREVRRAGFCFGLDSRHVHDRRRNVGMHLAARLASSRNRLLGQPRFFARCEPIRHLAHAFQIDAGDGFTTQRAKKQRHRTDGAFDQRDHRRAWFDRAIQHAIEQIFDFPTELTESQCADQAPRTFQGMKRPTQRRQYLEIIELLQPAGQLGLHLLEFFRYLFDKDLPNVVVDLFSGNPAEALEQLLLANDVGFFLFLDLDPLLLGRDRGSLARIGGKLQTGELLRALGDQRHFGHDEIGQIATGEHLHVRQRFGGRLWLRNAFRARRRGGLGRRHGGASRGRMCRGCTRGRGLRRRRQRGHFLLGKRR